MNPFRRNNPPVSKGKQQLADYKYWLNIFPYPALLIDEPSQKIIHANNYFLEFCGINISDTPNLFLSDIFADWSDPNTPSPGENNQNYTTIKHKNGDILSVKLVKYKKTIYDDLVFLSLEPGQPINQRKLTGSGSDEYPFWQILSNLISKKQNDSITEDLKSILLIGGELTSAGCVAVYLAENESPALHIKGRIGDSDWLPSTLLPEDVTKLRMNYVWKSSKRQLSALHRLAMLSGYNYLSSAPIGNSNALVGIVLFADKDEHPPADISEITGLVAEKISSVIHDHLNSQHLRQEISALKTQNSINELIEKTIRIGVLHLDKNLNIIKLNNSAENILGYNTREVVNTRADSILLGSINLEKALQDGLSGSSSYDVGDIRLYRRSGELFPAHASVISLQHTDSKERLLVIISDLSEQLKFQEQAEKLEQQAFLGEVSAIFAHEVRNPINNLSTGLELLESNLTEDDPNRELVTRLRQDCDRFEGLMKSILTFSKPIDYAMVKVDILYMLNRLLEQFSVRMEKYHISSQIYAPADLPFVHGNYRALEQVFTNIIDNAIQAMKDQGGQLAIKIQEKIGKDEKNILEISIADTGAGISGKQLERIFQPFYTTKGSGTGLGLAISKRIITAHKGKIIAQSFPGCSIFQIQIPTIQSNEDIS